MVARHADAGTAATVVRFTKLLPGWLRRCGVQRSDLDDAVQDASVEVLERLGSIAASAELSELTEAQARHELMRIVSNVALRVRRRLQRENDRYSSIEPAETLNSRDEEAWVEARALVLAAIENMDEKTRALIFAHVVEGRTNGEIAAGLNWKEDAVEYRVQLAKQKLRSEVERLEQGRLREHGGVSVVGCFGFLWQHLDPTDRALMGAAHEAVREVFLDSKQSQKSTSSRPNPLARPNMPTTALMGALVFAPMVPTNPIAAAVPEVKRISSIEWPPVPVARQGRNDFADPQNVVLQVESNVLPARPAQNVVPPSGRNAKVARESVETNKASSVRVSKSFALISVPESRD